MPPGSCRTRVRRCRAPATPSKKKVARRAKQEQAESLLRACARPDGSPSRAGFLRVVRSPPVRGKAGRHGSMPLLLVLALFAASLALSVGASFAALPPSSTGSASGSASPRGCSVSSRHSAPTRQRSRQRPSPCSATTRPSGRGRAGLQRVQPGGPARSERSHRRGVHIGRHAALLEGSAAITVALIAVALAVDGSGRVGRIRVVRHRADALCAARQHPGGAAVSSPRRGCGRSCATLSPRAIGQRGSTTFPLPAASGAFCSCRLRSAAVVLRAASAWCMPRLGWATSWLDLGCRDGHRSYWRS